MGRKCVIAANAITWKTTHLLESIFIDRPKATDRPISHLQWGTHNFCFMIFKIGSQILALAHLCCIVSVELPF